MLTKQDREKLLSLFIENLSIRSDLQVFAENDPKFIQENVRFLNTGKHQDMSSIVMHINMDKGPYKEIIIAFNNSDSDIIVPYANQGWVKHPFSTNSSKVTENYFELASLTASVFVKM